MGMESDYKQMLGVPTERVLDTCLQEMVKGSMHFPVYHYDAPPHKATGNTAWHCEISSLEIVFGIESSLKAEFKQLCIPGGPVFLGLLPAFASAEAGTCCHLSIPLTVATLETRWHI